MQRNIKDDAPNSSVPLDSKLYNSMSPLADATYSLSGQASSSGHDALADLSLSELSINDRPEPQVHQPFSLLARPSVVPPVIAVEDDVAEDDENVEGDKTEVLPVEDPEREPAQDPEAARRSSAHAREERLKQDLFVLRKLNSAFSLYNDALGDAQSNSEVLQLPSSFPSEVT